MVQSRSFVATTCENRSKKSTLGIVIQIHAGLIRWPLSDSFVVSSNAFSCICTDSHRHQGIPRAVPKSIALSIVE